MVLDNAKLEKIWFMLRQHIGLSNEAPMDSLNYDEFCQAKLNLTLYTKLLQLSFILILKPPLLLPYCLSFHLG